MSTLTRQIIKDVVSEEVKSATDEIKSELKSLGQKVNGLELKVDSLDQKANSIDQKVDTVVTQLTDIASQFKKFDEEQTVLSGQMSNRTDRIEKLEVAVLGAAGV
ncbi:hypothetical protein A3H89_05280 [Candidatus Amesbacteria bacterium RIFCSPLOWO2_02_FULL_48_11]|uniref:Uncharacterized protein n=4 Tax=Candidatus Amesiibacteriota TaxID=1752730 RepID=A0A0G1XDX7_9BACT|nr:MAG: hypothetical protein UX78_C0012G0016 [Candidatus Amesbacteria bacterium GW2011_GWA2_47_11]KKU92540.1 MAG: hypothetical protein UY22_C0034G0009 [Candidatus Amesbacteria bacterium GW2011_GWC1_48_10]KKU99669.1 MAG: hypothetical protein UY33_C0025G0008 [Candidatus Amesbacteria bacterium GW2011_GWA1_48_9]OGD02616.1 MAG: hypothetical protein A2354_02140 [Candidatus Amesbacteria bacterium RIFOXYB1_FULL_47_12]OGD08059.1 MAG: hypothetical protein A3H89_05280 [Candidatus Amesbacteria bacterium RI